MASDCADGTATPSGTSPKAATSRHFAASEPLPMTSTTPLLESTTLGGDAYRLRPPCYTDEGAPLATISASAPIHDWSEYAVNEIDPGAFQSRFSWRKLWRYAGPGWLMAIAYLDPGNLESDLQSGSVAGYQLIWLLFWTHAIGLVIQCLAAKLGVVTGRHLAQHANAAYPRLASRLLWLVAEIAIIGSDIQEIVGTAVALRILLRLPLWAGVLLTAVDSFLFLFLQAFGVRWLEAFFVALIGTMAVCFWVEMGLSHPSAIDILKGLAVPHVPKAAITQAVGMVGAVIMPHNIFLHSALVMSRRIDRSCTANHAGIREANFYFRIESAVALISSFLINMAIMVVFAQVFYDPAQPNRPVPGLYDAADVLQHALGTKGARYLWAVGLLAAGQSSTMTGTMAGQYVMEGFWQWKIKPWQRIAITRSIALVPSLVVGIVAADNLDSLGEILNVLQSIQLPFALVPIIKLTASTVVVGTFINHRLTTLSSVALTVVVMGFNAYLLVDFVDQMATGTGTSPVMAYLLLALFAVPYVGFIAYLAWYPIARRLLTLGDGYGSDTDPESPKLVPDDSATTSSTPLTV
ncbi:hypothetical protein H4R34_003395 [Dimargaris verticillata]|uniref:Natural resistance-associated macrophage protein-domain-containing protein n=1 Tax=Dimargaris verticillata TaxID=2761393 RepID=A0A9W8B279_9FUNG|nr:hypothetical protein H4R34_003395 [Dimargaris verticillata]